MQVAPARDRRCLGSEPQGKCEGTKVTQVRAFDSTHKETLVANFDQSRRCLGPDLQGSSFRIFAVKDFAFSIK